MKVGILTFWWSEDNYGQLLQCYALQKYLRDAGHDAYLIRYISINDYIKLSTWEKIRKASNPIKLWSFLANMKRRIVNGKEKRANPRNFTDFRNKHINQSERIYYTYKELFENPPFADVYIVGSDQVWNTGERTINRVMNLVNAYLLNFGNSSVKRISYAASFGKEKWQLESEYIKTFASLLKNFDYVSVREKSGLEICKQCGIENAECVPDPTMLLDIGIYQTLYTNEKIMQKPDKPYCFLYLLGNEFNFSVNAIYNWAKSKNIEVIYIAGNLQQDKYKKTHATIPEWIYLLEHSDTVITNSYHCTIFSLLFRKKFGIIPLAGRHIGMNSRFDTIFQLFSINSRFIDTDFSIFDVDDIDWRPISKTFQEIRTACRLNGIISGTPSALPYSGTIMSENNAE